MALNKKKGRTLSPTRNFVIEHLIEDSDGNLRPLRPEDVDIDNNKGVREAFRLIYEWYRAKHLKKVEGGISDAYSDAMWPLIPMQSGHPFRSKLATCSDPLWPAIPMHSGHPRRDDRSGAG